MFYFLFFYYDKINKNQILHDIETNLLPMCFFYNNNKKNITRRTTIWKDRIIVHDIENNPFWCVFLQQQKKWAFNRETATNEQKGRIGKDRTILDIETIFFSTEWYQYYVPFCL